MVSTIIELCLKPDVSVTGKDTRRHLSQTFSNLINNGECSRSVLNPRGELTPMNLHRLRFVTQGATRGTHDLPFALLVSIKNKYSAELFLLYLPHQY